MIYCESVGVNVLHVLMIYDKCSMDHFVARCSKIW